METQDLVKYLSSLKRIEPDAGFVASSKRLVLATELPRRSFSFVFRPTFVGSFAVFFVAFVGIYLVGLNSGASTYASLSPDKLKKEIDSTSIDIQLKEITYRQSVTETVASALQEISSDKANHLNKNILKNEASDAAAQEKQDGEIDELLNRAIF